MNSSRGAFTGRILILLALTATSVSADSISQPNLLTQERGECGLLGNVGLNTLTTREPNERLFAVQSYASDNTAGFSTKRMRSSIGVGITGFAVQDPGSATVPNPEPATLLLLGSGLTGLGWAIRRRRRAVRKTQ